MCKQWRPRSDWSWRSSLTRVYTFCHSIKHFKKQLYKKQNSDQKSVWNFQYFLPYTTFIDYKSCFSNGMTRELCSYFFSRVRDRLNPCHDELHQTWTYRYADMSQPSCFAQSVRQVAAVTYLFIVKIIIFENETALKLGFGGIPSLQITLLHIKRLNKT